MLRLACGRLIWIKSRNIKDLIEVDVHIRERLIWINDGLRCDASQARPGRTRIGPHPDEPAAGGRLEGWLRMQGRQSGWSCDGPSGKSGPALKMLSSPCRQK
ncbi:hypothetical protein [Bradyrhizobium sp. USDA 4369]